ncbi:MAG: hypothetical protein Ct9H90mP9_5630 [Pseudomonadota bacterium]|nr:MAG: hypothetical protein Ct9H90mP9_5630 [Pseudomonadota bacterium]
MKTSVISETFRKQYLSRPGQENIFEVRAIVFDGPEDYHARIKILLWGNDVNCILVIRGCGPVGYPGVRRGGQHAATRCLDQAGYS